MDFSIADVVRQNTLGQSDGFPAGVPESWNWYKGWNDEGMHTPPADFTAVEGWGAVYQKAGAPFYSNSEASIEVANAKTFVHLEEKGQWVLVQDQSTRPIVGGHFVTDFAENAGYPMVVSSLQDGRASFAPPPTGYNDHFWYQSRGTYTAGTVDAVYVQMDMRVTDPNLSLLAIVGADWWRDASAPYLDDHSNNPGIGSSNWVELSTQWKTLGYYSMDTTRFQNHLPPTFRVDAHAPTFSTSVSTPPEAPRITSFTPDTDKVGDKVTSATTLTLSGTAEPGSNVMLFDGSMQIGTAIANASGAWSIVTSELVTGTHNFTAKATNVVGNTSPASSLLSIRVGKETVPARSTPPSDGKLLQKQTFDATDVGAINLTGSAGGDALYPTTKNVAWQAYHLSLGDRPQHGLTSASTTIDSLSNGSFILLALIFGVAIRVGQNGPIPRRRLER